MHRLIVTSATALGILVPLFLAKTCAAQQQHAAAVTVREPDVLFVPTPKDVVNKMLDLAQVKKTDLVYDLGCGDGRIVVAAAKRFGCKAVGYDIDPERVRESRENVKKNKVEHLVTIEQRDVFKLDLSKANVVTLYLLSDLNVRLIPQLEKLKPGSRIVSHDFDMEGGFLITRSWILQLTIGLRKDCFSNCGSDCDIPRWISRGFQLTQRMFGSL